MPTSTSQALTSLWSPAARPLFVAAKSFLDATYTGDWTNRGLHEWFDRHLVSTGWMPLPIAVNEPGAGSIPLHGPGAGVQNPQLLELLSAARAVVITNLRGLLTSPSDDRFLAAVIYAGRVRRRRLPGGTEWTPNPEPSAPLSAVVLSVLVADILAHREFYERQLTICDLCAKVGFEDVVPARRRRCAAHAYPESGTFPAQGRPVEEDDEDYTADEMLFKRE